MRRLAASRKQDAVMEARNWADRTAAGVLLAAGVALLVAAALSILQALPDLLGSEGEHMAGDAMLWVMIIVLPMTVGGLIALAAASLLWQGSPIGWVLTLGWVLVALLACGLAAAGNGNLLSAGRMVLLESGDWSLSWPMLGTGSGDGAMYYTYLDEVTSWIPVIVAGGAILVVCLGIASWNARRHDREPANASSPAR